MNNQPVLLTREQLYEKVWSRPVWSLAREWGISDVGLAKICKRHNIPRPGLGYWAKRQAGVKVQQKPLPKGDDERIKMTMRYSHLSPAFQKGSVQLLNGLCEGILEGSEGHSEKIVKNRQKDEEVRQIQSPNLS